MIQMEELYEKILTEMDLSKEVEDDELVEIIHRILDEKGKETYISLRQKSGLGKELFNAFRKLDILQELIEDDEITEIMINGINNIFVEKQGQILELEKRFITRTKLEDVIQQIVAGSNRIVNEASPIVDARLPDGSRVNVVLYPIALNGPIVTIRKFPKENITMEQLVRLEAVGQEMIPFLKRLMEAKYNVFISGGTGSGKTTFLNALSDFIPKDERIITIEDNAELRIQNVPNLVRLEARNANVEGTGEITIRDLIKSALRMRPSRIIVGEVRGREAIDMLQSLNAVNRELSCAALDQHDGNYMRKKVNAQAYCAAYVVGKRYGADVSGFQFGKVAEMQANGQKDPQELRGFLNDVRQAAYTIRNHMERNFGEQEQTFSKDAFSFEEPPKQTPKKEKKEKQPER